MNKKYRQFTEVLDEFLEDPQFAADFLSQALEEEDFDTFLLSLKDVVRVHGSVTAVAQKAHISRSTLYNLLAGQPGAQMRTILALLGSLGYQLKITPRRRQLKVRRSPKRLTV